jgi:hypothetical protein
MKMSKDRDKITGPTVKAEFHGGDKMGKVIAINGSPRKNGNTATLLQEALGGAVSAGAETEMIHLIDLNYKF